ncbi:unannotated protein [freshwater metagenome]|uniref:Unannotated protein n=1 Tax=freshwater metagenome TaxID=449393 RepID=A0A6J7AV30_9ZZZZ
MSIEIEPNPENARYLETKRERMGHVLQVHEGGANSKEANG